MAFLTPHCSPPRWCVDPLQDRLMTLILDDAVYTSDRQGHHRRSKSAVRGPRCANGRHNRRGEKPTLVSAVKNAAAPGIAARLFSPP
jgi:hypothetical protein